MGAEVFHTWDIDGMMEGMTADRFTHWKAYFRIKERERTAETIAARAEQAAKNPKR